MGVTLRVGDTVTLRAAVMGAHDAPIPGTRLVWSTTREGVAAVTAAGTVRGVAPGVALIRVAAGTAEDTAFVTVGADGVVLERLEPAPATALAPGARVIIRGTVRYALTTAPAGDVAMVVQDQRGRPLQDWSESQPSWVIGAGDGTATLVDTIDVPAAGVTEVHVFLPVAAAGATRTETVTSARYRVR
jgi:hypothetical protein